MDFLLTVKWVLLNDKDWKQEEKKLALLWLKGPKSAHEHVWLQCLCCCFQLIIEPSQIRRRVHTARHITMHMGFDWH